MSVRSPGLVLSHLAEVPGPAASHLLHPNPQPRTQLSLTAGRGGGPGRQLRSCPGMFLLHRSEVSKPFPVCWPALQGPSCLAMEQRGHPCPQACHNLDPCSVDLKPGFMGQRTPDRLIPRSRDALCPLPRVLCPISGLVTHRDGGNLSTSPT